MKVATGDAAVARVDQLAASVTSEVRPLQVEDILPIQAYADQTIEWVVEGVIARGTVTVVSGDSGAGKSTLLSAMADAISKGESFLGRATSRCPVLILDRENPISVIVERFHRLGIQTDGEFKVWGQWAAEDPPMPGDPRIVEWIKRCKVKPVIIVDSLIAFHPGSENDASETRRYMNENFRWLTALGATVIVLHHVGRDGSTDFRGSQDIKGSIDVGYKLTKLGDDRLSVLELKIWKQRVLVSPPLQLRYRDGVFSESISPAARPEQSVDDRLIALLRANPGVTGEQFERLASSQKLRRASVRAFLSDQDRVLVERGSGTGKLYFLKDQPHP